VIVPERLRTVGPVLSLGLGVLTLAVLGSLTWQRSRVYANEEILWRDTLRKNPDAFIASNNLGAILLRRGEFEPATDRFEKALRAKPDFAEALDNLGLVKHRQGELDEAVSFFRKALQCDPRFANAHNNLGIVLAQRGQMSEAMDHFQEAVRIRPSFARARQNLGLLLERRGRTDEAVKEYREALRWSADAPDIAKSLAWILATDPDPRVRNGAEALRLAEAANVATGGKDPQAQDILAAAYAEAGRFDDAVRAAERALALVGTSATVEAREGANARLAHYRAGRAFRRQTE